MKINKVSMGLFLAGLVILPGCVRVPTYRSKPLHIFKNNCAYTSTHKGITVSAKRLNRAEASYIFDDRIKNLSDTQIIYLTVYNINSRDYIISPEDINIPYLSYTDLVKKTKKTSSFGRLTGAVGAKAVSFTSAATINMLFTAPAVSVMTGVIVLPLATVAACVGVASYITSLAFLGGGIKSIVMNRRIHHDLQAKIIDRNIVVESGEKYEGLIFVKSSDYRSDFTVTLYEKDNLANKITFDANLDRS